MLFSEDEVLQEVRGVHAGEEGERFPWSWVEET